VEDGFLRSVGLGADLVRPLSWVFDDEGIYYDARSPSAIETMLARGSFDAADLERARALREQVVRAGLTKYNLAAAAWNAPTGARRVVLAVGQVETDASIASGTTRVRTNLDLLKAVRTQRPDAFIVYKPHPDVVAGLRGASAAERDARQFCDAVVTEASMHSLLQQVDEVHVMTSLAGFEALLRNKPVVCWGDPFYAGWGLTRDAEPHPRRSRERTLDELVCAALIRYPVYFSPRENRRCTPEEALQELAAWRESAPTRVPLWRRCLRPLIARP
jgi:capsular polysaccharide export protein